MDDGENENEEEEERQGGYTGAEQQAIVNEQRSFAFYRQGAYLANCVASDSSKLYQFLRSSDLEGLLRDINTCMLKVAEQ